MFNQSISSGNFQAAYGSQRNLCISHRKGRGGFPASDFHLFHNGGKFFMIYQARSGRLSTKTTWGKPAFVRRSKKVKDLHYDDTLKGIKRDETHA